MDNNRFAKGFPMPGLPGQGMNQLSNANKEVMKLVQARERGKEMRPVACKCGNRALLRQEIVEAVYVKYPKMLGLPEEQFPEEFFDHRVLTVVFICPKCKSEVCSQRKNKLIKLKGEDGKERQFGEKSPEKHPESGKKE